MSSMSLPCASGQLLAELLQRHGELRGRAAGIGRARAGTCTLAKRERAARPRRTLKGTPVRCAMVISARNTASMHTSAGSSASPVRASLVRGASSADTVFSRSFASEGSESAAARRSKRA